MNAYAQNSGVNQAMFKAIAGKNWQAAKDAIRQDPVDAKLYEWFYLRKNKDADYRRSVRFVRQNPDWPSIGTLKSHVEKTIPTGAPPAEYIGWFDDYKPRTARGFFLYADALIGGGQTQRAKTLIDEWWSEKPLTREQQKMLYTKYARYISMEAHRKRLDTLIAKSYFTNARGVAKVLGNGHVELTEARIALAQKKKDASAYIKAVPFHMKNDPGLRYERLKWRRRNNANDGAIEILMTPPPLNAMSNPREWWMERHIMARRLIEKKRYNQAYKLVSAHVQESGLGFAQAEFLAGWLALRFLNNPYTAYTHFETLYKGVKSPISKARAGYWAGRTAAAVKQNDTASQWYKIAAQFQTTFYGQTAAAELGIAQALTSTKAPNMTMEERTRFGKNELVLAAQKLHAAGLLRERRQFIDAFVAQNPVPQTYAYAMQMATRMKANHESVRLAKASAKLGLFFTAEAYPIIPSQLNTIEFDWALIHGLIRQESQFDVNARSPVGARGLMQLMPATAKETAQKLGIRHQTSWLTSSPKHNITLGSAYITQMMQRYGGSYPLAIAAYNAGPGRVDKWLKINGDPRTGKIDMLDWIEMIPIYETRNYVQRVLEASYVYRLRLKPIKPNIKLPIHVARVYNTGL